MTVNQLLGGRYQFLQTLGSNSPTNTYLVADISQPEHPKCVVKRLPITGGGRRAMEFVVRLLRKKAEALKQVSNHEQIPKILAHFAGDNSFYLVEEFVPGRPLSDILIPGQALAEPIVVRLLQELLKILLVLHSWGVIHRCIKPSNIIQRQSDGKLVLTGFGVFKEISAQNHQSPNEVTQATTSHGLPYLAPELSQGQRHFSGDIYSVGIIGIQALTGLSAIELDRLRQADSTNGRTGSPPFNWSQYADASPAMVAVLNRMVAPHADQRYQTVTEVLEDLQQVTADQPGAGPPAKRAAPPEAAVGQGAIATERPNRLKGAALMGGGLVAVLVMAALALRIPQKSLAQFYLQQATHQTRWGEDAQAIDFYTQAIQTFPTSTAYLERGIAHFRAGEWQAAQQDLAKTLELNPDSGLAYYYRGNIRYELGDRLNALADYTAAVERDPTLAKAYTNRGNVRAEMGDEQGAIADYTAALRQDPGLAGTYLNRCLSRSNVGDHQGAIADCNRAIDLEPTSVLAYQNRGLVRRRLEDINGAIADFNIAIRLNPEDADPYYNRGLARLDLGDVAGAIQDFNQAIHYDSSHPFVYYERAMVRHDQGDEVGAIADLQQSAQLCMNAGMVGCYEDAQYQLSRIQATETLAESIPSPAASAVPD